jgi:hypothetical protein
MDFFTQKIARTRMGIAIALAILVAVQAAPELMAIYLVVVAAAVVGINQHLIDFLSVV